MAQARVQVINEVEDIETTRLSENWSLWYQWCRYLYDDGEMEYGYRFIWKRPDGSLQAARGQARLPSIAVIRRLLKAAEDRGWGGYDANEM